MSNTCKDSPCWCLGRCTQVNTPVCNSGGCIRLGTIIVKPEDSKGPCGKTGRVDFKCFDVSGCCNKDVKATVINIDKPEKLTVGSITKDYLEFTTTNEANALDKIIVTIKISCCGLADYGQIIIFIKDPCECISCETGFTCDKCTEECIPIEDNGELILIQDPEYIAYTDSGLKLN